MSRQRKSRPRKQDEPRPTKHAQPSRSRVPRLAIGIVGFSVVGFVAFAVFSKRLEPALEIPAQPVGLKPPLSELIERYDARVRSNPRNAVAQAELALVYEANTFWPESRQCYANATRLKPDEPLWKLHHARVTLGCGDVNAALAIHKALGMQFPNEPAIQHHLAVALLDQGDLEKALRALRSAASTATSAPILTDLGDVLLQLGKPDEALQHLQRAVQLDPNYLKGHYVLGLAFRAAGQLEKARAHLQQGAGAERLMHHDSWSDRMNSLDLGLDNQLNKSDALFAAGRPDEALAVLEQLRAEHPRNHSLLVNLGVGYITAKRPTEAIPVLNEAAEVAPYHFATFINLAAANKDIGRLDEALGHIDRAIQLSPDIQKAHVVRGRILRKLNRGEDAAAALATARRYAPDDTEVIMEQGGTAMLLGRWREALEAYRELNRLVPDNFAILVRLVQCARRSGEIDEALIALEHARRLAPDHPDVVRLQRTLEGAP
jgi:tetratricopeptide (TPR) repeat protein